RVSRTGRAGASGRIRADQHASIGSSGNRALGPRHEVARDAEDLHSASGRYVGEGLLPDPGIRMAPSAGPRVHRAIQIDGEVTGDGVERARVGALGKGRTGKWI